MGDKEEKKEEMNKVSEFYEGDDQWYTIDEYLEGEEEEEQDSEN